MKNILVQLNESVLPMISSEKRDEVSQFIKTIVDVTPNGVNGEKFIVESLDKRFGEEIPELSKVLNERKYLDVLYSMNLTEITTRLNETLASITLPTPDIKYRLGSIYEAIDRGSVNVWNAVESIYNVLNDSRVAEFKPIMNSIESFVKENREAILVTSANSIPDYIDDNSAEIITNLVESYVLTSEINDTKRNKILEKLEPFISVSLRAKSISNNIKTFLKSNLEIASRNNFVVEEVHSFVNISPKKDRMLFANNRNLFEMNLENFEISKLNDDSSFGRELNELNSFVSTGKNRISGGKIIIAFNEDRLVFSMDDNQTKIVEHNGKIVEGDFLQFFDKLSKMSMIRNKNKIIRVFERLENFMVIDFAKNICTKDGTSQATIFNFGNKFYADLTNPITETNKFLINADANQLRTEILEFMSFDLEETLLEFLNPTKQELNVFNSQLNVVNKQIFEVETMIKTLEEHKNSNTLEAVFSEDVDRLYESLKTEIEILKNERADIQNKIFILNNPSREVIEEHKQTMGEKYFGYLKEDATDDINQTIGLDSKSVKSTTDLRSTKIRPNMQVLVKNINKHGVITSVNTVINTVNIVTTDGRTLSFPIKELDKSFVLIQDKVIDNIDQMKAEGSDVKNDVEAKQPVTESMTPQSNSLFTGVGIEGKFAPKYQKNSNPESVINDGVEIKEDDMVNINGLISKMESAQNIFVEVEEFLKVYNKISKKPVDEIMQQLDSFVTILRTECEKIK